MTDLSVVVPTCNRATTLPLTLAGLLAQERVDVEVIVVDDHSTDATAAWLATVDDPRVRVVRTPAPGSGPAVGRNLGLAEATAALVGFCDDDDVWAPTKACEQLEAMAATGARWSCSSAITIDGTGRVLGSQRWARSGDVLTDVRGVDVIPGGGSSVIADRALLLEVGGFDPTLETQHDWELWIRLAERSPLAAVDRPLMAYRVWGGAMSRDIGPMERAYHEIVRRHDAASIGTPQRRACDRLFHQYLARMELREGHRLAAARRHATLARRYAEPRHLFHAAAALLAPCVTDRWRAWRELHETPASWLDEGRPWLAGPPVAAGH